MELRARSVGDEGSSFPKGNLTIAQRFIAGYRSALAMLSPGGTSAVADLPAAGSIPNRIESDAVQENRLTHPERRVLDDVRPAGYVADGHVDL